MTTSTACVLIAAIITVTGGLLAASYPFLVRLAGRNSARSDNPGINGKLLEQRLRAQEVLMATVITKVDGLAGRLDELKESVGELYRLHRG